MIKKRWRRVVLTLGLIIATVHLYLSLFAVQERAFIREGRRLDSYVIRGISSVQPSKVTRVVAINMDGSIFYRINKTLSTRNPKLPASANMASTVTSSTRHAPQTLKTESVDDNKAIQILIIAYIRSGSSLTGDILQQDPDSFYVYEPLHFTEKMGKKLGTVQLLNGNFVNIERPQFYNRAFTILNSYFDCDLSTLDFGTLVHGFQTFGNKTNRFIQCYVNKTGQRISKRLSAQLCGVELKEVCQKSKFRAIKTIRVPMLYAEVFLKRYPDLKLIHLVRDPRAQVNSIDSLANTTKYNRGFAKQKCSAMESDFYYSEIYRTRYPGRVMRLYYEDLASSPIQTSKSLYDFTGMNFSPVVRDYITSITSNGRDSCAICSKRANSSEHVQKWRRKMEFSDVQLIDNECQRVYDHYGFIPARTEAELRDLDVPLRRAYDKNHQ